MVDVLDTYKVTATIPNKIEAHKDKMNPYLL